MASKKKRDWSCTIVEGEDFKIRKDTAAPSRAFKNKKAYKRRAKHIKPW